jgi:exo-beta-1,3-glucanase (GH17 family)
MARAICHQCKTKTVFIGSSVKIAGIPTKGNQTEEAAAQVASIDVAIEKLIVFLKSYYIDAAPCSSHSAINDMKKAAAKGKFGLPKVIVIIYWVQNRSGL